MDKWEKQHRVELAKIERRIKAIYEAAAQEAAAVGVTVDGLTDELFRFSNFPLTHKRITDLLQTLHDRLQTAIINGVDSQWILANNKNNELCRHVFGDNVGKLTKEQYKRYFSNNDAARDAFLARKEAGLGLSDKVWQYTDMFKTEVEMGLDVGIRDGLSAGAMARELKAYLQNPDELFRRVRDEHGQLVLSQAAKVFHPGQGVYRSSYKNALRLAVTETNMAYRTADYERRQMMDFVVGIEVHLSGNHTSRGHKGVFMDICDQLQGKYPKDFKFTGWHPNCRCYTTSILKTAEEMEADDERIMRGQGPREWSENQVTDVPDGFKQWVSDNEDRIGRAARLPYFLRDNGTRDRRGVYTLKEFRQPEKVPSPLEIAAQRHAARTPQQIAVIQARADARQAVLKDYALTEKRAGNILNMASGWHEVSFVALQTAMDTVANSVVYRKAQMEELKNALKGAIAEIKAQQAAEKALADIIPNVHKWHEQFTLAELQGAKDAVKKKVLEIQVKAGGDLAAQKKLMEKEMFYVSDGNYLKPHTLHKTWEVAHQSYIKQIGILDEKIAWQPVEQSLSAIKSYSAANPKSLKIANLIAEAEKIKASGGSIASVMAKIAEAEKIKAKNEASVASHAKKAAEKKAKELADLQNKKADLEKIKDKLEQNVKAAKILNTTDLPQLKADLKAVEKELKKVQGKIDKLDNELGNAGDIFSDAAYSDARKGVAQKFTNAPEADDYFHQYATEIWPKLTDEEKEALWEYTAGSGYITEPLRAINGHYYYYSNRMAETEKHIRALTTALDKCALKEDVFIKRDDAAWGVEYVFGIKDLSKYQSNPKALVGMVGTDESFISCGSCKNTFFTATGRKDVIYNIYCPKGTKGTYCQPFSSFGTYGKGWDGTMKSNPSNRNENEFLLQRGTKYRITGAKYDAAADKWTIDIEVIGQLQRDFVMKMGSGGYYCEFL